MLMLQCPHCQWQLPFVPGLEGRELFCLGCGRHFLVKAGTDLTESDGFAEAIVFELDVPRTSSQSESGSDSNNPRP